MQASSEFVTLQGGFVVPWPVLERLLDLEIRGASFRLVEGDRFRVEPSSVLTEDDRVFLRAHREEARACVEYAERMAQRPM